MKIRWSKVKNGKLTKIKEPKSIDALLNKGYVVSKVTEEGNNTKIETFSPRTYVAYKQAEKQALKETLASIKKVSV